LEKVKNISYRAYDISKLTGGIHHAKYFVVDGKQAFVGSQNFDWRSLDHTSELGVKISQKKMMESLAAIFEMDWNVEKITTISPQKNLNAQLPLLATQREPQLFASPPLINPIGIMDSESAILSLIESAQKSVEIHLLSYATNPKENVEHPAPKDYLVIDNALTAAAKRGVKISMLLSDWSQSEPKLSAAKKLAAIPNIQVKFVTIPQAKAGFIPYARTIHSKFMVVDGEKLILGTSNWAYEYFHQLRNVELFLPDPQLSKIASDKFQKIWNSAYSSPVDVNKEYTKPKIAD
jgi:phosphatidylserine/phosphatidylglycerophosphate/cardiolipin synthase-like enzyme